MESKTSSLLALIAGIINIIIGILLIGSTIFGMSTNPKDVLGMNELGAVFGIPFLVLGILFLFSSKWMKNQKTAKRGAIWSLVLGILSIANLPSGILGIVAGIMGLSNAEK